MPQVNNRFYAGNMGGYSPWTHSEMTGGSSAVTYAANTFVMQVGGNLTEIKNVGRYPGATVWIVGMELYADKKSITPRFRVRLSDIASPTLASSGSPFVVAYANATNWLPPYDLPAMTTPSGTASDCSRSWDMACNLKAKCAEGSTSLYWGLEALDAFTSAANGKYTLVLFTSQD